MPIRNAFTPDYQYGGGDNYDPYGAMTQPIPPPPATPLSGGSTQFASPVPRGGTNANVTSPGAGVGVATNPAEPGGFTGQTNPPPPSPVAPPTSPTTPPTTTTPPQPNSVHGTGQALNIDVVGNLYDANGNPVLGQNGQQIRYTGVTGTYIPPPKPPTPPKTTTNPSPLGDVTDAGLLKLAGSNGMTPEQQTLLAKVNQIIAGGGALPSDTTLEQSQLESARESETAAEQAQLNDARDELAARGLASEPGAPGGQEGEAIQQIQRNLAPNYAQAVQGIQQQQIQTQNARLTSAIATASGLTSDAAGNLLQTLGQGTQRQIGLAQIALDSLQNDQQWQEFLANYGLNRDQILNSIQQGNVGALATLIQLFLTGSGQSAGGHV